MKYLVAVSGGVDSVVLLDMLMQSWEDTAEGTRRKPNFSRRGEFWDSLPKRSGGQSPPFIVAHFDHGIRPDSAADARFVSALAAQYGLPFVGRREELGPAASEERARSRRYLFLGGEALLREARIVTAHHQDDIVETIAINLTRGTGWRGLAVLDNEHIVRPLLRFSKQRIREYALARKLEWVEDSTNASDAYLRNRLRRAMHMQLDGELKRHLLALRQTQCDLRREIEIEDSRFFDIGPYSRYFFTCIDDRVAEELLRYLVVMCVDTSPTRPHIRQALNAIKTARPHTMTQCGGVWLNFGVKDFRVSVKTP